MTKAEMFLQLASPDSQGKTRLWYFSELETHYPSVTFQTQNGGDWCRSDNQYLKRYIVHREKEKNRIVGIRLDGFSTNLVNRTVKPSILKVIKDGRCSVLDIGGASIECDHKDGRYSESTYGKVDEQQLADFQPLSRNVNLAKRTHCNSCKETGKRYDARNLGYKCGWTEGDEDYIDTCKGCYWYDIRQFNWEMTRGYGNR